MFFGCLIPSLVSLSVKLKKMAQGDNLQLLKGVPVALESKLSDRFSKFFTLLPEASDAIVAAVLSPDVKMRWFKTLGNRLPNISESDIHNLVIRKIETILDTDDSDYRQCEERELSEEFYDFDGTNLL